MAYNIVKHRRGTTKEWQQATFIPEAGELIIEECIGGIRRCKVGDGVSIFNKLPYIDDFTQNKLLADITLLGDNLKKDIAEVATNLSAVDSKHEEATVAAAKAVVDTVTKAFTTADSSVAARLSNVISDTAKVTEETAKANTAKAVEQLRQEVSSDIQAASEAAAASDLALADRIAKSATAATTAQNALENRLTTFVTTCVENEAADRKSQLNSLATELAAVECTVTNDVQPAIEQLNKSVTDEIDNVKKSHNSSVTKLEAADAQLLRSIEIAKQDLQAVISAAKMAHATKLAELRGDVEGSIADATTLWSEKLIVLQDTLAAEVKALSAVISDVKNQHKTELATVESQLAEFNIKNNQLMAQDIELLVKLYETKDSIKAVDARIADVIQKHTNDYLELFSVLDSIEIQQKASDTTITNSMLNYVSKIYDELSQLVSQDLILISKVHEFNNNLNARIDDLAAAVDDNKQNAIDRLAEVKAELTSDIDNTAAALSSTVSLVENALSTNIANLNSSTNAKIADTKKAISSLETIVNEDRRDTQQELSRISKNVSINKLESDIAINKINKQITAVEGDLEDTRTGLAVQANRISNLLKLEHGSTTGDAELLDIRELDENTIYDSAGDAVRAVNADVKALRRSLDSFLDSQAIDGLCYDYYGEFGDPYMLYLTSTSTIIPESGVQIISGAGGGGGGSSTTSELRLGYITTSPLIVTTTDKAVLRFTFSGTDSSGDTILQASATWKVNGTVVAYNTVSSGNNEFDVTPYLAIGTTKILLLVTDDNGSVATKTWSVQQLALDIESNFNDKIAYAANEDIIFSYTPYGAIDKTAVFILDGKTTRVSLTSDISGREVKFKLPAKPHGAYLLEYYIEARINDILVSSPRKTKDIIWYDALSDKPVIGAATRNITIKRYTTTNIVYTVYDPSTETPSVTIEVDGETVSNVTLKPNQNYNNTPTGVFSYTGFDVTEDGHDHIIKIICGDVTKLIYVKVESLGFEIVPITDGLVFDFNPAGKNNGVLENRLWTDGNISMSTSANFDWTNGGYIPEDPDGPCFCIKAGTRATVDYRLFEDDPTSTGKEFKIVFKTKNVANPDTIFLSCLDTNADNSKVGIQMAAQEARIYGQSGMLDLAYSENDVIEFEFNISSSNSTGIPMVMGYEDGVPSRPMVYDDTYNFRQNDPKEITLGSDDCDLYIYRFKVYNTALTNTEILNNFIADARSSDELVSRYNRNQIYDENNKLTPEILAEKCPWLRVYKLSAPYFTNNKSEKVANTTIQQIYKNGDPVLDNWTCYNAQHSGQGTSSNNYGAAGRNLDFIMNKSSSYFELGDGTTTDQITLTRQSVPVSYLNAKVNIASSNNLTNAILAARYNEFNPYRRPFVSRDGLDTNYIKDTMEFHNCVIFIQETAPDVTTHREFADTDWHFYAIGNIGDSKKTDNTRLTDPNDDYECCIEIMDVGLPLSDFPADTMISAMEYKVDEATNEKIYKWAKTENLDLLYERKYSLTTDTEVNLNKTYYIDLPVKVEASYTDLTTDNLSNLFDRVYVCTTDTSVVSGKVYYSDADGTVVRKDQLEAITNPQEAGLFEWQREYKKTTDTSIIENKIYYVEVLQKCNAMEYDYEDRLEYIDATDDNLPNLYELIDGQYVLTGDATVDLTKTYYIKQVLKDADGNITEVSYLNAMSYTVTQVKVYRYATNDNLDRLYEVTYDKTNDTEIDLTKTYYIDILVNDDFSEDYTYGWRYISDEDNTDTVNFCKQKWIDFYRFVTTSTDSEFKAHLSDYFVVDSALFYYLFTTRYCMVDNRAKNTFWHYSKTADGTRKWDLCWDYDNDTSLGLNNFGKQVYRYGLEDIDKDDAKKEIFRESDSTFFCRLRDLFKEELMAMYKERESVNAWHAESFLNICDAWQEEFPEELWRLDIERKYIRTYTNSFINGPGDKQFLVNMCNGRMKYHRRQWERNQEQYMASKYQTTRASGDRYHANLRVNSFDSTENMVVKPNYQFTITPFSHMYLNVWYGDVTRTPFSIRANPNEPTVVPCPAAIDADIINIGSASSIIDFGDLSMCYPDTVSIGNALRVKTLKLGNSTPGYNNALFTSLTTDDNPLLEVINVENISGLDSSLDFTKLINLREFYARGTNIPGVLFAPGGRLTHVELPAVSSVTLQGQNFLHTTDFSLSSYNNVIDLIIENCPNLDIASIYNRCNNLMKARLLGVDFGTVSYQEFTPKLYSLKGIAISGTDVPPNAILEGRIKIMHEDEAPFTGAQFNELHTRYPDLSIEYEKLTSAVIFKNTDLEEILHVGYVDNFNTVKADYINPVFYGDTDEIPEGMIAKPTKESTDKFHFHFIGWSTSKNVIIDPELCTEVEYQQQFDMYKNDTVKQIEGDRVLYPVFSAERRAYKVTYINPTAPIDRQVLAEVTVLYGNDSRYPNPYPTKLDAPAGLYVFKEWYPSDANITGNRECHACFTIPDAKWYTLAWSDIKDCVDYNGNVYDGFTLNPSNMTMTITGYNNDLPQNPAIKIPIMLTSDRGDFYITAVGGFANHVNLSMIDFPASDKFTEILPNAFYNCYNLLELSLPSNITTIGRYAFQQCSRLKTLHIPKSVISIGEAAFADCQALAEITVEQNNPRYYTEQDCLIDLNNSALVQGLSTGTIPQDGSIRTLGPYCFSNTRIVSACIPELVEVVANNAFSRCLQLKEITLPDSLHTLDATCFAWCSNLTSVTLPKNLVNIRTYAFDSCGFTEVEIPANVENVLERAFGGMPGLQTVTFGKRVDKYGNVIVPSIACSIDQYNINHSAFAGSGSADHTLTFNVPWTEEQHNAHFGGADQDPKFGTVNSKFVFGYNDYKES